MRFPETPAELLASPVYNQFWYYTMELLPGVFTRGAGHRNLGLTRHLLAGCAVEGRSALDIGTMEAAVPVLLSRRGASTVVGVDVAPFGDKVDAVKHYTGTDFQYEFGLTHGRTAEALKAKGLGNFDMVVLSGVLYHCFGPLHTLGMARSLVRAGGLMIVETYAALDDQIGMFFNAGGRFTADPSTYFLLSVPLLDYLLRYFKLLPLDCVYGQVSKVDRYECLRIGVACRAVGEVVAPDGDAWMEKATDIVDYLTLYDWTISSAVESDPVEYRGDVRGKVFREWKGRKACDLMATARQTSPMELGEGHAVIRLKDRT